MTKKEVILQLRKQGTSIRNIAWKAGVAKSYVTRVIKAEKENSQIQPRKKRCPECGRLILMPCAACLAEKEKKLTIKQRIPLNIGVSDTPIFIA